MATSKKTKENTETLDAAAMSKKEMEAKRKEITKYYEDNIPALKVQLEYEELLRDIEKTRAERLQAQMFIAQTMAPAPEEDEEPTSEMRAEFNSAMDGAEAARQIKRSLKRDSSAV